MEGQLERLDEPVKHCSFPSLGQSVGDEGGVLSHHRRIVLGARTFRPKTADVEWDDLNRATGLRRKGFQQLVAARSVAEYRWHTGLFDHPDQLSQVFGTRLGQRGDTRNHDVGDLEIVGGGEVSEGVMIGDQHPAARWNLGQDVADFGIDTAEFLRDRLATVGVGVRPGDLVEPGSDELGPAGHPGGVEPHVWIQGARPVVMPVTVVAVAVIPVVVVTLIAVVVAMVVVLVTFLPILGAYYLTRGTDTVAGQGK